MISFFNVYWPFLFCIYLMLGKSVFNYFEVHWEQANISNQLGWYDSINPQSATIVIIFEKSKITFFPYNWQPYLILILILSQVTAPDSIWLTRFSDSDRTWRKDLENCLARHSIFKCIWTFSWSQIAWP